MAEAPTAENGKNIVMVQSENGPTPESLEMIRRLIAFDTTSRNSNLDLIDFVRDFLAGLGIDSRLTYDDQRRKANLYATLGPSDRGGVLLSGHTDVVPVDGQEWHSDPFSATQRDGRLYGRGTCDMKGFVAICLAMAPEFLRRGLETPIHYAFTYDEEVGMHGARRLIAQLKEMPIQPALCVVGEPTEMEVVTAHKGKLSIRCRVHGYEAHSSIADRGANAVEAAAEVVAYLKGMARRFRDHGPFDRDYDPPYTTVHTGVIAGGTALNIVPSHCSFDFEIRHLPGDDPRRLVEEVKAYAETVLLPEMRAVSPDTGFEWEELASFAGLDTPEDAEVTRVVQALSGQNPTGKVSFGTEAGLFQECGIPTIVCGPGSIRQAHKPDEFIALEQVVQCEAFLRRLMDRVCQA
jgi:acetylornithine deacetylase